MAIDRTSYSKRSSRSSSCGCFDNIISPNNLIDKYSKSYVLLLQQLSTKLLRYPVFIVENDICLIIVLENPALVNYVDDYNKQNQNNHYSTTYNPRWRQHINFSWGNENQNQHAATPSRQNKLAQSPGFFQENQG